MYHTEGHVTGTISWDKSRAAGIQGRKNQEQLSETKSVLTQRHETGARG